MSQRWDDWHCGFLEKILSFDHALDGSTKHVDIDTSSAGFLDSLIL